VSAPRILLARALHLCEAGPGGNRDRESGAGRATGREPFGAAAEARSVQRGDGRVSGAMEFSVTRRM